MASVFDVAEYVLERLGPMPTMKLQKLVYYCQAWHLAWDDEPLFDAEIEAWASGPVVPQLYETHRGQFIVEPGFTRIALGDPEVQARVQTRIAQEHARRQAELRAAIERTVEVAEELLRRAGPLEPARLLWLVALTEGLATPDTSPSQAPARPASLTVEILEDLGVEAESQAPVEPGSVRVRLAEIKARGAALNASSCPLPAASNQEVEPTAHGSHDRDDHGDEDDDLNG